MNLPNFDSESIEIDWLSFNVVGLHDPITIASNLSKYFKPYVAYWTGLFRSGDKPICGY